MKLTAATSAKFRKESAQNGERLPSPEGDTNGAVSSLSVHVDAAGPSKSWKLKRVRQCKKCPWKASTNPHDIPDGYCETRHRRLSATIADPGEYKPGSPLVAMACHEHPVGDEAHCIGWLVHQLGPGNNIALRLAMLNCENVYAIQTDGPQHQSFEDTFPKPTEP